MYKKAEKHSSKLISELLKERDPVEIARNKNKMLVAAKIDDGIKAKNWSRSRFAEEIGKKPSVITKWLSGTHNFTQDTLTDIEIKLGIRLLDLKPKEVIIKYQTVVVRNNEEEVSFHPQFSTYFNQSFYKQQITTE